MTKITGESSVTSGSIIHILVSSSHLPSTNQYQCMSTQKYVIAWNLNEKKKKDANNIQTMHAFKFWARIDKYTIMTSNAISPRRDGPNLFMVHITNSAWITGDMVYHNSRAKHQDLPGKEGTDNQEYIRGDKVATRVQLII
jgi:hypothetical protein